jgi:acetyl-CoA carboxylase beta subunit
MKELEDECDVCMGENGMVVGTVTVDALDMHVMVMVCRPCLAAMGQVMGNQWNQAIADQHAAVDAMKRMLGIEDV